MTSDKKLEILVCNDDGATANGIFALAQAMKHFGKVTVVAPDSPQSGMGHAISIAEPLRISKIDIDPEIDAYACTGTPVDCVKLATGVILKHKPDLLVSGINHGLNSSISVFYSGTMSAAIEGAIEGIPSIGFSLDNFDADADFTASAHVASIIVQSVLAHKMPRHSALNVNIPRLPISEIKDIRITRQAYGRWVEEFEQRVDPYGRKYYWLTGRFQLDDDGEDTDIWALRNGYVSVCPVEIDATAHHNLAILHTWNLNLG